MKDDIMYKMKAIQDALNNIEVRGKQNITLMAGIMNILDEIVVSLNQCTFDKMVKDEKVEG